VTIHEQQRADVCGPWYRKMAPWTYPAVSLAALLAPELRKGDSFHLHDGPRGARVTSQRCAPRSSRRLVWQQPFRSRSWAATAVFDNCTVKNVGGGTAATAPNTDQAVPYGLVFLGGQLTADASVKAGSVALGRNWGAYGAAAFLRTTLGAHISGVGWSPMGENTLDTARFSEYKTTGPGATLNSRASQSKQLNDQQSANYTLATIFGAWVPSFSK
jgi:Pectinesterase